MSQSELAAEAWLLLKSNQAAKLSYMDGNPALIVLIG
jgi:hypothetical protein